MPKFYTAANEAIERAAPEAPDLDYLPAKLQDQLYSAWWEDLLPEEGLAANWANDVFAEIPPRYQVLLIHAALMGETLDGFDVARTIREAARRCIRDEVAGLLDDHARDCIEDAGEVFVA